MSLSGERLREIRKKLHLTQKQLGELAAMEWYQVKDLELGKTKNIPYALLKALETKFSVNPDWLMTGEGEKFSAPVKQPEPSSSFAETILNIPPPTVILMSDIKDRPDVALQDYYAAPLLKGEIAAGAGRLLSERDIRAFVWIYAPALSERRSHHLIAVEVSETDGASMMPLLFPGDIVLIDRDDPAGDLLTFKSGAVYAIRTGDGGCAVKRLYKSDNGLIIGSDNVRKYAPQNAWSQNLTELIIGRVVWGWRNLLEV